MSRAFLLLLATGAIWSAEANTFTVTNNNDSGAGSLRQAITDANNHAGADTVAFNIPGAGVHTIVVLSDLPNITDPIIIDGYTQPGATQNTLAVGDNAALKIEINGNSKGGFVIIAGGDGSTIKGLVLNRFVCNAGVFCGAVVLRSGDNVISGNFIGTDVTGNSELTSTAQTLLVSTGSNNLIGGTTPAARNLIAGNTGGGSGKINVGPISFQSDPAPNGTIIRGNYIGTNANGTASLHPQAFQNAAGINIAFGSNTIIGGADADDGTTDGNVGARNLISGNLDGINISPPTAADGVAIKGNFIGVNATGTAALANFGTGIVAQGTTAITNLTIGGTTAGAGNVISGNVSTGILLSVLSATVQGNYIGPNASGTAAIANGGDGGIACEIGGNEGPNVQITIGGTTAAARNLISGNTGPGIFLSGIQSGLVTVQGNYIGVAKDGHTALGNLIDGIKSGRPTVIGGTVAGAGNVIANNTGRGVNVNPSFGSIITVTILGNSIYANGELGIDLNGDGVTPNDAGDADTGSNNLQNYPVLTSTNNSGGMTNIIGSLNSAANKTYRIEFFSSDTVDPTSYGEGKTFLGFKSVTTNASGNVSFTAMVPQVANGQHVTATATDPNNNTSEFSGAVGQLLNLSTRMQVLTGGSVLIGGFIVGGTGNKQVLLRSLGPTLQNFGVADFLGDPTLELHDGTGALLASNDNWKDTQQAAIAATGKAPPNDLEPAILRTLTPGNYTGIVRGKNNTTGVGLIEAYDIDQGTTATLTNISTRGFVDIGQNVMIGGFISGNGVVRVIVRALGPTLTGFGVPNVLADPTLELRDAAGNLIASNDNWAETQQAEIQASGKAPPNANESAIIAIRPPGNNTAIVRGKNNATGNALVDAYILP